MKKRNVKFTMKGKGIFEGGRRYWGNFGKYGFENTRWVWLCRGSVFKVQCIILWHGAQWSVVLVGPMYKFYL
jgi:hypothetical protein